MVSSGRALFRTKRVSQAAFGEALGCVGILGFNELPCADGVLGYIGIDY